MTFKTSLSLINLDKNMNLYILFFSINLNQWTLKTIVTKITFTRHRFKFVIISSFFRDTFDKINHDYKINFIVVDETFVFE